ncbi:hypothetical protein DFQ05_2211 [Winogradskyella wandonensis]|uniref:GLPGLI family protein n=1 Tax=Winogradskyella wandonensis TaxID=1442586 RepID=A0A4R1KMJ2_9FLAO|nr:hypothetical protein [Winogradskyella wandonensis]TCK64999.1 hypothetical protein DFQ05_2211 [Winogradskyella wandonensis]
MRFFKIISAILFLLFVNLAVAQYSYTPAKVFLKDGSTLSGEVDLIAFPLRQWSPSEEFFSFKANKSKKEISVKSIDSVVFSIKVKTKKNRKIVTYKESQKFIPIYIKENKEHLRMVRLIINDKLILYSRAVNTGTGVNGNGGFTGFGANNQYFVAKNPNQVPVVLLPNGPKRFRKEAMNYFSDCTDLVEKIESKELKREDIIEIVQFYNTKCTN